MSERRKVKGSNSGVMVAMDPQKSPTSSKLINIELEHLQNKIKSSRENKNESNDVIISLQGK